MCGLIYVESDKISKDKVEQSIEGISFRGPDFSKTIILDNKYLLSHCRLSILDLHERSNQPMTSKSGRYSILFNGEIYNYKQIANELKLKLDTTSDTEVVLEGYELIGDKIFEKLDGMFAIVIYDLHNNSWVATRDLFGIKPLYIYKKNETTVISSETKAIKDLVNVTPSLDSVIEWEIFRSPIPGKTFYNEIDEVLPGQVINNNLNTKFHSKLENNDKKFIQEEFEELLSNSIKKHTLSDVQNTALISGGIDSSIITNETNFINYYSIGLDTNNEFSDTQETSIKLDKNVVNHSIKIKELINNWKYLTQIKGEPIFLPNEGLIYEICKQMNKDEKVFLTGEGADELLFGYDRIFRWAMTEKFDLNNFLKLYTYSRKKPTNRFLTFIEDLNKDKSNINFLEDFFIQFHLKTLLRRMDFSSMVASKEARVPFVDKSLFNYMYRKEAKIKLDSINSKLPLRKYASKNSLEFILNRKKIGFSAKTSLEGNTINEYDKFRDIVLSSIGWENILEEEI